MGVGIGDRQARDASGGGLTPPLRDDPLGDWEGDGPRHGAHRTVSNRSDFGSTST
jgi:hypothetical protein